jgi:hypothetical protein
LLGFAPLSRFADDEVVDEAPAEELDLADNVVDQFVGQAEFGDTVAQHAAQGVEGFEDGDRVAFGGQQIGVDEARRAGADHRDRRFFAARPGVGKTGDAARKTVRIDPLLALRQEPFDLADFDRLFGVRADALALQFLRTDAAGDVGQGIDAFDEFHRFAEASVDLPGETLGGRVFLLDDNRDNDYYK